MTAQHQITSSNGSESCNAITGEGRGTSQFETYVFNRGDKVICNGYPGAVVGMYSAGMVEVRVPGGLVCVSSSFPDCYPDTAAEASAIHAILQAGFAGAKVPFCSEMEA
jgi:hypothetical protein